MRKSGFIMLLLVAFLLSIQVAAACPAQAKDGPGYGFVVVENKTSVQEEVRVNPVTGYISESVAAFAVRPIQAEVVVPINTLAGCYSYCVIPCNFSGSAINKISAMPGGDLLYAGFL